MIANETVTSPTVREAIRRSVEAVDRAEVAIVAPALNSRLRHWLSDSDGARRGAEERLARCLAALGADGIAVRGWIGDADPVQAIDDALHVFAADKLIIATHPEGRSNWLARGLVPRARERFAPPVLHIVVDAAAGEEYVVVAA